MLPPEPYTEDFSPADMWQARARLRGLVLHTPLVYSRALSARTGGEIYLKMECWQHCGCFKVRGALNMVHALTPEQRARGLVTASSGNHGAALSYAALSVDGPAPATVFLPEYADRVKVAKVQALGAEAVLHGANFTECLWRAVTYAEERGATYVHSHAHPLVIAGQGTIGLEILEDLPDPDIVLVPVGGGGILAGIATAIQAGSPATRIIGAESSAAPGAFLSFRDGFWHDRIELKPSIADGVLGTFSRLPYEITRNRVESIVLIDDAELVEAMRAFMQDEQIITEPASAIGLAAILAGKVDVTGQKTVIVISSRNIHAERFNRLINQGLGGK
jgi:threonine dehydratase